MTGVTVNQGIVSVLTWLVGMFLKKVPWINNDMIPQITYLIATVATYAVAVLGGLAVGTAHAAAATVPAAPSPVDTQMSATVSWILTTAWDWLGRKVIWGKVVKKIIK
jgi:hypothetical protein